MTPVEKGHLRRLLGWLRCEVGQTPEEQRATMASIAHALDGYPGGEAQRRVMESYDRAASVPRYVRHAIKALEPLVREGDGAVVDAEPECNRLDAARTISRQERK